MISVSYNLVDIDIIKSKYEKCAAGGHNFIQHETVVTVWNAARSYDHGKMLFQKFAYFPRRFQTAWDGLKLYLALVRM